MQASETRREVANRPEVRAAKRAAMLKPGARKKVEAFWVRRAMERYGLKASEVAAWRAMRRRVGDSTRAAELVKAGKRVVHDPQGLPHRTRAALERHGLEVEELGLWRALRTKVGAVEAAAIVRRERKREMAR